MCWKLEAVAILSIVSVFANSCAAGDKHTSRSSSSSSSTDHEHVRGSSISSEAQQDIYSVN
jgi:hypothetical protein